MSTEASLQSYSNTGLATQFANWVNNNEVEECNVLHAHESHQAPGFDIVLWKSLCVSWVLLVM